MTHIPENIIQGAVSIIINTRDFCGDERTAVYDYYCDNCLGTKYDLHKLYRIANFRANKEWNGYKKAAGVNPKYTW